LLTAIRSSKKKARCKSNAPRNKLPENVLMILLHSADTHDYQPITQDWQ
jgi:hypothetical protein